MGIRKCKKSRYGVIMCQTEPIVIETTNSTTVSSSSSSSSTQVLYDIDYLKQLMNENSSVKKEELSDADSFESWLEYAGKKTLESQSLRYTGFASQLYKTLNIASDRANSDSKTLCLYLNNLNASSLNNLSNELPKRLLAQNSKENIPEEEKIRE